MLSIKIKTNVLVLCLSLMSWNAVASPTQGFAEVIPGPGLPSLESLGLTSADLYRGYSDRSVARDSINTSLAKRVPTTCQNIAGHTVSAANAKACVTYLRNLGTTPCGLTSDNIIFCQSGDAAIGGSNLKGQGQLVSSYCSDVAIGAQNILNQCTQSNGQVEGYAAANGNGDIVVSIEPLGGA
ncbi:hypothetical protein CVT25_000686 [Psilocybe cyanescens]|uniref:Cyanovirin-N domain-containing protein n=1 Tax=Psilocybe cyanescens TaxID=93625 RepID=A0A409XUF1_PSICY|nr:hypothetical protein CVT25_000686 [Psilocybe cyanescens]